MHQLSQNQTQNVSGGLLDPFLGIIGIDAGLTLSGVLGAIGLAGSIGWGVGSWIANHGGAEAGGSLLCEATGNC